MPKDKDDTGTDEPGEKSCSGATVCRLASDSVSVHTADKPDNDSRQRTE